MCVVASRSVLVVEVESTVDRNKSVVYSQRMVPYPVTPSSAKASSELKQQAQHYNIKCHRYHLICGMKKKKPSKYEVLVNWLGFDERNDDTWKAMDAIEEDMSEMLKNFLQSADERNQQSDILHLYL